MYKRQIFRSIKDSFLRFFQKSNETIEQEYFVGIDLGTTKTSAAYGPLSGKGEIKPLPFSTQNGAEQIPSVVEFQYPSAKVSNESLVMSAVGNKRLAASHDKLEVTKSGIFRRTKLSIGRKKL